MLSAVSRLTPLSNIAIGATGAIGACLGGYLGSKYGGIPGALSFAQVGGILGLELGETYLTKDVSENVEDVRANTLEEFLYARSDISSIVKCYLFAGFLFSTSYWAFSENLDQKCDAISDKCLPSAEIGLISGVGAVASLIYAFIKTNALESLEEKSAYKRNYIFSTLALGAIGTAGIVAGGVAGYMYGGISSFLPAAQAVGFLGLLIGERYLGRYLKKDVELGGLYRYGQFFNDRQRMINIVKHYLLAGALWSTSLKIVAENLVQKFTSFSIVPSFSGYSLFGILPAAVASSLYAIYRTRVTYVEMDTTIRNWVVNDRAVRVFIEEGNLKLEITNLTTKCTHEQSTMHDPSKSMKEHIEHLCKCELVLDDNGGFSFAMPEIQKPLFKHWKTTISRQPDCLDQSQRDLSPHCPSVNASCVDGLRNIINGSGLFRAVCGSWVSKDGTEPKQEHWGWLSLLKGNKTFVWQVYLMKSGKTIQTPFCNIGYEKFASWVRYHRKKNSQLEEDFRNLRNRVWDGNISANECREFLDDFHIINETDIESSWAPNFLVKLKPIIKIIGSYFDKKHPITEAYWAVTLICTNGCNLLNGNHAAIIVEGIKDGKYFMKFAHLHQSGNPKEERGEITIKDFSDPEGLKYTNRNSCKTRHWSDVNRMLENIEKQKKDPPVLEMRCDRSLRVKSGKESCITWAIKNLATIGILIEEHVFDRLITITCLHTPIENPRIKLGEEI